MSYNILGLLLFVILSLLYIIEVLLGSCLGVYNPELGQESSYEENNKLSQREFFTELLPFFIAAVGISLWICLN